MMTINGWGSVERSWALVGVLAMLTACGDNGGGGTETGSGTTSQMSSTSGPDLTTGTPTTDTPTTSAEPTCGDGQIDPGETCDDGANNGPGKACSATCQAAACGDGEVGPGEECDDGVDNGDMKSCTSGCTNNVCGDGFIGPGEGCDDGNQVDDDECTNYSSFPATTPTRQLTSKRHGRNRWFFSRLATGPPTASPRPCPPGLEKTRRRARAWKPGHSVRSA